MRVGRKKMKKIRFPVFLIFILLTVTAMSAGAQPAESAKGDGDNYIFIFQVTRYDLNIAGAVDFIFDNIIKPEDSLTIFTPVKSYSFSKNTRKTQPQKKLVEITKNVLKRDINIGSADYNRMLENMAQLIREIDDPSGAVSGGDQGLTIKNIMINYRQLLDNIRSLRKLDDRLFLGLAQTFKNLQGKNFLYILYQKELRPIPRNSMISDLKEIGDIKFDVMALFETGTIDKDIMDVEKVSQAMKAGSVTVNFIYINMETGKGMSTELKEFSTDIYSTFSKLAGATGGIVEATSKPVIALEKAFKESQQ
jgi:hypothetical protein